MTKQEAYERLELPENTDLQTVRKRFADIHNDYRMRIDNAPTPRLKETFEKNLEKVKEAYNLLNESDRMDDTGNLPRTGHTSSDYQSTTPPLSQGRETEMISLEEAFTLFGVSKTDSDGTIRAGVNEYMEILNNHIKGAFNSAIQEAYQKELEKAEKAWDVIASWMVQRQKMQEQQTRQTGYEHREETSPGQPEHTAPPKSKKILLLPIIAVATVVIAVLVYFFVIRLTPEEKYTKAQELEQKMEYKKAFEYYMDAAEADVPGAQYKVSMMMTSGLGTVVNDSLSDVWLNKAVALKEPRAQYVLGKKYLAYREYLYNKEKGDEYLSNAYPRLLIMAEENDPDAEMYLADLYKQGIGVTESTDKGLEWEKKARKHGNIEAQLEFIDFALTPNDTGTDAEVKKESDSLVPVVLKKLRKMAAQGSGEADFMLAGLFFSGYGVDKNTDSVVAYVNKAVEKNYMAAIEYLAYDYSDDGDFYGKDEKKSLEYYIKAAKRNIYFQTRLGNIYYTGALGEENISEAYKWYKKAADKGETNAQFKLGEYAFYGYGNIQKDINTAYKWYQKAAVDQRDAQYMMGKQYYYGYRDTIDYQTALQWFVKASDNDNGKASFMAGYMLKEDYGYSAKYSDTMSIESSSYYFETAYYDLYYKEDADMDAESYLCLAKMYTNGWGVSSSYSNANKYIDKCIDTFEAMADDGDAEAQYLLGEIYHYGYGVNTNNKLALEWSTKSAEQNFVPAMYFTGMFYYLGWGMSYNDPVAFQWFTKAEEKEYPLAYLYLGYMYKNGYAVSVNRTKANEYFNKAADRYVYKGKSEVY